MPTIPTATHLFLVVVPLLFGLGALAHFALRGRHER
jgi:hypothetical protein